MMKREERKLYFYFMWAPHDLSYMEKKLSHVAATWTDERSNMIDRPLVVFFKHFGYFECKYDSIVSIGCPMLLGGYLEGRLGPLPLSYVTKI